MIIRHAEKPAGSLRGVTPNGDDDSESLTTIGWARAGALTALFAPSSGPVRPGLVTPANIIAANPDSDRSKRPAQTVTPLAQRLGLTIDTSHVKRDTASAAKAAADSAGPTLMSWQHELIPELAGHLGRITTAVPTAWPDDRFDVVWIFHTQDTRSWQFTQVPQSLLAGDSTRPIR